VTLDETPACSGVGRAPQYGEITFVEEGRLMGVSPDGAKRRCLADLSEGVYGTSGLWNASGDRLLLGNDVLGPRLTAQRIPREWNGEWSRPTGTSLIRITNDGRLEKLSLEDNSVTDISFLARHDDVAYHPAGTHLAVSGEATDGSYGVYIVTNQGTEPQLLARGEESRDVFDLVFSEGGRSLYFVADHGKKMHLHRLSLNPASEKDKGTVQEVEFDTLKIADSISNVVLSPFDDSVAWMQNADCAAGLPGELGTHFFRDEAIRVPSELADRSIVPIGWLPGGKFGKLVVHARTTGCSTAQPADIHVLTDGPSHWFIAEQEVAAASIRVTHPPPPPPPDVEQEVVA
jgi:hypothetical protein